MLKRLEGQNFACDSKEHGDHPPVADYYFQTQFYMVSLCEECARKMFRPEFFEEELEEVA